MVRPLTLTSLMASLGRVDRFALFPDLISRDSLKTGQLSFLVATKRARALRR